VIENKGGREMKTEKIPDSIVYKCSVCGELFDYPDIWHCPGCGHHWRVGLALGEPCPNCHITVPRTPCVMKSATITWNEDGTARSLSIE